MKILRISIPFLLFFTCVVFSSLWAIPKVKTPYVPSVRQAGLGNAVTSIADDEYLLFVNPAGLGLEDKFLKDEPDSIVYFNFASQGFSDIIEIKNLINDIQSGVSIDANNISGLSSFIKKYEYSPLSVKASTLGFSYLSDVWGLTFLPALVDVQKITIIGDLAPSVYINTAITSQFSLGFKPLDVDITESQSLSFGFALRPFYLMQVKQKLSMDIISSFSLNGLSIDEGVGGALDLGFLYKIMFEGGHQLSVGLAVTDAPGFYYPIVSKQVGLNENNEKGKGLSFLQPNPKVGVSYRLPDYLDGFFTKTLVSMDIHRWLDSSQTFGTKFHMGLGSTFIDFQYFKLALQGGINGGLFTGSVVMYFVGMRLEYALYQEELGYTSGANPFYRHELGFSLYF